MKQSSPAKPKIANQAGVISFVRNETSFVVLQNFISAIKAAWPKKTAAHVAHFTGTTERTVQFWLAGSTRMSLDAVAALLRTDEGYQILEAVMGDCQAEWWLDTKVAAELRTSRKMMRAEQRRTARLKELRAQRELYEDQ